MQIDQLDHQNSWTKVRYELFLHESWSSLFMLHICRRTSTVKDSLKVAYRWLRVEKKEERRELKSPDVVE